MELTTEEIKKVTAWREAEKELEESAHWIIAIRAVILGGMGLWLVSVFFPGYVLLSLGGYFVFYIVRWLILLGSYHVARFIYGMFLHLQTR